MSRQLQNKETAAIPIDQIRDVQQLESALSDPSPAAIEAMAKTDGDLVLLGVNGKMGPTLAMMARKASDIAGVKRNVIGVSRFGSGSEPVREQLENAGIQTVACDLLNRKQVASLPDAKNIIFLAGMKFGSAADTATTWAMNAYLPALVCERYPDSRIAAFSTGNVYGPVSVESGGATEQDPILPVGEYAMSCLGRERMFEYFSRTQGLPVSIIRLNYAVELRYGVIVDLALKLKQSQPIDLQTGYFNAIWQADANAMTLASLPLADSPPFVINVTGPETLSVRQVVAMLGEEMGIEPTFTGQEGSDALLSCGQMGHDRLGYPRQPIGTVIRAVARWVNEGGEVLNKPTKFESRDGRF